MSLNKSNMRTAVHYILGLPEADRKRAASHPTGCVAFLPVGAIQLSVQEAREVHWRVNEYLWIIKYGRPFQLVEFLEKYL